MKELVSGVNAVTKKEDEKPYKPNIFEQVVNVFSVYSYYRMRELHDLNQEFTPVNALKAKEIVIEQKNELGPFFGFTQFISTRDLVRKSL